LSQPKMSTTKTITYTTTSVPDFLANFAGRRDIGHDEFYHPERRWNIADCNRDYVWPQQPELAEDFIRCIIAKDAVPAVLICNGELIDAGNRATTLWLFANDALVVDSRKFSELPRELFGNWCGCTMPITIIENATEDEKAGYYEKFNKGIVLTLGQKLENRKNRPLIAMAMRMIGRGEAFPLKSLQDLVWTPRFTKTKPRSELATAYRILVSSILDNHRGFHTNFALHSRRFMSDEFDREADVVLTNLEAVYRMLAAVDPENAVAQRIKKSTFKTFIGAILFDFHRMSYADFCTKWQEFFRRAYNVLSPHEVKSICKAASKLRASRRNHQFGDGPGAISEVVARYLDTGLVPRGEGPDVESDDDSTE
jgi:hypothetical protein